jgi:regulator of protease activity HflC (stomatin/prohibitin superfamily)
MGTLLIVVLLIIFVPLIIWLFARRGATEQEPAEGEHRAQVRRLFPSMTGRRWVLFFFIIVGLIYFVSAFKVIDAGNRGVVFNIFTGVEREVLGEGLHFVPPVFKKVTRYDIRTHTYTMVQRFEEGAIKGESDTLWAPTSDGLKVGLDMTVRYKPLPDRLPELHQSIGPDYEEKVVRPVIRNVARMVVSEFTILDVYSKQRKTIEKQIFDKIQGMFARDGLLCESVLLRDVIYTKDYEDSLVRKMMAEQKIQELEFEVQQAQKRAEARIREAQGEATAFEKINQSIEKNPDLLQYMWIHKLADDVKLMVVPREGSGLILNTGDMMK